MESATLNFSILVCIQKEKKHGDKQSIFLEGEGIYILASVQTKLCIFFSFRKLEKTIRTTTTRKKNKKLDASAFFFFGAKAATQEGGGCRW